MVNIKLVVEYDGTNYQGMQIQQNGRTIQGELQRALSVLVKQPVKITAAGRTDAGVHARGQVVNFRSDITVPVERIPIAANSLLPLDIRVVSAQQVPENFHARYDAKEKTYSYQIYHGSCHSVFLRHYALWVAQALDWQKMEQASQWLIGTHDFASFAASGSVVKTTTRTIKQIAIKPLGNGLMGISFTADGFLYNMVRNLVGTLIEVGTNRREASQIPNILAAKNREAAGPTAPPHGLYLESVLYLDTNGTIGYNNSW